MEAEVMQTPEVPMPEAEDSQARGGMVWQFLQRMENILTIALLVVGITPLFLMAVLSFTRSRTVLQESIEREVVSVTNLTDDRVERWLNTREADAKTYSSIIIGERPQASIMRDILDSAGETYEAMYFTDLNGVVQSGIRRVVAEDGSVTYEDYQVGHDFMMGDFFKEARNSNLDFYRSTIIEYEPFDGVRTMFLVHIVLDLGSRTAYVVLQVNPEELQGLAEKFSDGDGASYLQSGSFLVNSESIEPLPNNQEAVRTTREEANVSEFKGFSGETVLGAWSGNPDLNYVVYAQIPKEKALSAINSLALILLAVALIAVVLISVVAYFSARYITAPIKRLTNSALQIAGGSMDARIEARDLRRGDELGKLAKAFNAMTNNVRVQVSDATENRTYLEEILTSYMKFVERVSRGDLTARLSLNGQTGANLIVANVRVDRDDNLLRLGYNLNRMVEALHGMASQTRDVARSLSEAAVQILESSTQQIGAATQQDAAVSQTTSTVAEVRATVAETAERAQMVAEAAQQSVEISRQGQHAVAETIEGMNVIRSRVESIAENILMLSERTTQIGDIIATVNAIADQSKMLALNASIEAARAGEEGRGFAVVAMEVRNLAEQSREATAQVRDILSEIQTATNTAVMVTEEGTKGVDLGVQLVDRAGRAIRELASKLEEASQSAMQIAASTRQQSQGMDQLTSAMTSIKASTGTTATIMQASQRSAKDLNEMARQMEAAISAYKL